MKKIFISSFLFPIAFSIFITIFIIPFLYDKKYLLKSDQAITFAKSSSAYSWPTPNYTHITSYFGYRNAPTKGASTYHGGIDIGAPQGTEIHAVADGIVKFIGWNGANGYCVMIFHDGNVVSTCAHISDTFLVSVGDTVKQGDVIAKVGPKYITGPSNNPYKDASGKTTNGATTGPHLHFALSINNKKVNPLDYLKQ